MSNEKDCLMRDEFAELIQHLSVQEILAVEFRVDTEWCKLFSRKRLSAHAFSCNLCILETSSFKNLIAHVEGRKHKVQMERVKELYHPDYTYPKSSNNNGLTKISITKKSESYNSQNVLNSIKQQVIVCGGKCKMSKDRGRKESSTIYTPFTENKLLKNNGTGKPITVCNKNELNVTGNVSSFDKQIHNQVEPSSGLYKTSNNNECDDSALECEIIKEVSGKNKLFKKHEEGNSSNLQATKNNTTYVEKIILSGKNFKPKLDLKNEDIVVNPAAAFTLQTSTSKMEMDKTDECIGKPLYQTDKIIIPTIYKNKSYNDQFVLPSTSSQTQSRNLPNFLIKSCNSNPSDNNVYGILGVEYVIKILRNRNDMSPRYECGLCEIVLDEFEMQRHLEGYNHRLKFCEKHFPTAIRHYRQYTQNVSEHDLFKVMAPIIARLAIAIEQHHGRNLPYECYDREYILNRHEILAKAFSCRHASEQYGPMFTHVVGSKEIDEFINGRKKYLLPRTSRIVAFGSKPDGSSRWSGHHQYTEDSDNDLSLHDRDHYCHVVCDSDNSDIIQHKDNTHKTYMSSTTYGDLYYHPNVRKLQDNINVFQQVNDETCDLMVNNFLKNDLKEISSGCCRMHVRQKRSASPDYNYISKKPKELPKLHKNNTCQDNREKLDQELYKLDERFNEYRKDPESYPMYSDEWQKFWKRRKDELILAGIDHREYNYQPEWVRYIKIRIEELYCQEIENITMKYREQICFSITNGGLFDDSCNVQNPKFTPLDRAITTKSSNSEMPATKNLKTSSLSPSPNESSPQVVSVLRLMTALEGSLGSLGPKILELLSKALQAEKSSPKMVNAVILNDENCSLIETAKEKLKGLVITGLFEESKERVLRKVVGDAELLLKHAYQFRHLSSANSLAKNSRSIFSSPSLSENPLAQLDKKELASKLAALLVAQGKTDFDSHQLQQLIALYTQIEKKKKREASTLLYNKHGNLQNTSLLNKKSLSETLSDLLKSTSSSHTSTNMNVQDTKITSDVALTSNLGDDKFPENTIFHLNNSTNSDNVMNCASSVSFISTYQNPSDNSKYSTQFTDSAFGTIGGGDNHLERRFDYDLGYINNSSHQNTNINNEINNNYWSNNNGLQSNLRSTYNRETKQNYNYNSASNWRNP